MKKQIKINNFRLNLSNLKIKQILEDEIENGIEYGGEIQQPPIQQVPVQQVEVVR